MELLQNFWKKYELAFEYTRIKIEPKMFLLIGLVSSVFMFFLGYLISYLIFGDPDFILCILLVIVVLDFFLGYPFMVFDRRISKIEEKLPDVLFHLATTVRAGGSLETALQDVAKMRYGPIVEEIKETIREMKEGKTFEDAFLSFGRRTHSKLCRRVATIIVTAKRSGAGFVDALTSISEDIRDVHRIARERKSKTTMQVIFLIVAGVIISPAIFGLVSSISKFMAKANPYQESGPLIYVLDPLFKTYILTCGILVAFGVSMIREGKLIKALPYVPLFLLVSYIIFTFVSTFAMSMVTGAIV